MESIIQAKYTSFAADDLDYPNTSTIAKKGTLPKPKSTIAADSIAFAREQEREKVHSLVYDTMLTSLTSQD
jgi:hypothetical protein